MMGKGKWFYHEQPCEIEPCVDERRLKVVALAVKLPGTEAIIVPVDEHGEFPGVTYASVN